MKTTQPLNERLASIRSHLHTITVTLEQVKKKIDYDRITLPEAGIAAHAQNIQDHLDLMHELINDYINQNGNPDPETLIF